MGGKAQCGRSHDRDAELREDVEPAAGMLGEEYLEASRVPSEPAVLTLEGS